MDVTEGLLMQPLGSPIKWLGQWTQQLRLLAIQNNKSCLYSTFSVEILSSSNEGMEWKGEEDAINTI